MELKREQIELGFINIPKAYFEFTKYQKEVICNKAIDKLLKYIEDNIDDPTINRINFLDEILESSIESNNETESFEVSGFLYDCRKMLNE
jgi:hypothetical protein